MIPEPVVAFLKRENAPFVNSEHPLAHTAQATAEALEMPGRKFAKTVILRTADGRLVMAVVPAPRPVDLEAAAEAVGSDVALASEADFAGRFPGCEVGAEPPFGPLYGMPVLVDESLGRQDEIVFNAGTHRDAIRMLYRDFERLVRPVPVPLSIMH
jgi:Ala-tRNA(Pro) deacylase